ncbi:hypothetical protein GF322_05490 [Candidatus Dependentiae bacterium]|nr:hypothetical protein [Candidatus Dependentiae bacterium]
MSINMKFALDLVLRNFSEFKNGQKKKEECIPQDLQENKVYDFLKTGQRVYWLEGEQPLLEKSKDGKVSIPKASVIILEATHFVNKDKIYSKGKYKVVKIINENKIYFNGCEPIK